MPETGRTWVMAKNNTEVILIPLFPPILAANTPNSASNETIKTAMSGLCSLG